MSAFQSTLLIALGIVAYVIIVDKNVEDYIILMIKLIKINIERFFWMIRLHPHNPITNLIKKWEYEKIAKELEEEFKNK